MTLESSNLKDLLEQVERLARGAGAADVLQKQQEQKEIIQALPAISTEARDILRRIRAYLKNGTLSPDSTIIFCDPPILGKDLQTVIDGMEALL